MALIQAQRMWNRLLAVCVPAAIAAFVWVIGFGGRPVAAALAGVYLLLAAVARAHALDRARRATPARLERVHGQVERVKATLPIE